MNIIQTIILLLFMGMACWVSPVSAAEQRVIAFAQDTLANDFRKAQVEEVRREALKHAGLSFVYADAQGQTSLMIHQIEQFIAQKVDLLIIGTNDENAVVPVVTKAYQAGIPVIVLDRGIQGNQYTTFINSDNILIGKTGAEYIAQQLGGNGLVLLFEGLQQADVTQLRTQGFLDEMKKHPGIRVIRRTGNYLRKDALLEMEKLVAQGIQVDAIFSESDSMLSGVRMVLNQYGIDPHSIVMVGCDYTSEAQQAILAGTQSGSVLFPLGGKKSVEMALRIFAHEAVPRHVSIPVQLITRSNADQTPPIF